MEIGNNVYYLHNISDYTVSSDFYNKCSLKHGTNEKCYKNKIKKRRDKKYGLDGKHQDFENKVHPV